MAFVTVAPAPALARGHAVVRATAASAPAAPASRALRASTARRRTALSFSAALASARLPTASAPLAVRRVLVCSADAGRKEQKATASASDEIRRAKVEEAAAAVDEARLKPAKAEEGGLGIDVDAYEIGVVNAMGDVAAAEWDVMVGPQGSCFLEHSFLLSLEEAGCAEPRTGWSPNHLLVREKKGGRLVAACPMYAKMHSQGEFVFDQMWAQAAVYQLGVEYYPKLLVGVPFTPHAARRILTHPEVDRPAFLKLVAVALRHACESNGMSGVHVNFCEEDEIEPLEAAGFLHRQGIQYHWHNRSYETFDDYLGTYKSKKRIAVKRERRSVAEAGIEIDVLGGDDLTPADFDEMYRLYRTTVAKQWGRQYLSRRFFELLHERFRHNVRFLRARRDGEVIAGTVNFSKAGVLYGRYWGAYEEIKNLHFEACYYASIEHCIGAGVARMEPGAGGESQNHKFVRGFEPRATHSLHYLTSAPLRSAVERFVKMEADEVDLTIEFLREAAPYRTPPASGPDVDAPPPDPPAA
eukprot:tig00001215_g7572.t1